MLVESTNNENCIHGYWLQVCKDCVDVSFSHQTQLSYESDDCYDSYKLFYSKGCHDSSESYFLLNCRGCTNCIGCANLRQKQYHIFNKPYSKDEYEKELKAMRLDTASGVERLRERFSTFLLTQPRKYAEIVNGSNVSGNYIKDAKNCKLCFHCFEAEDSKYGVHVWRNAKWCMDTDTTGRNASHMYNSMNAGVDVAHFFCSAVCWSSTFMDYSYYCFNSNHSFGSVGLREKDYCILNKQYSKEEYEKLREQIITDMKRQEIYGEFFPITVGTFGYNESAAQEQFPLTKEEALTHGFKWEDYPRGTFGKETLVWNTVPDSLQDFDPVDITKEIFVCRVCKKNYRIIQAEFGFYKRLHIPIPRLCPDCRHMRRFQARGPNRLWHRQCTCGGLTSGNGLYQNTAQHFHGEAPCPNEFETSYAPERKEIVYCEACYQSEVI